MWEISIVLYALFSKQYLCKVGTFSVLLKYCLKSLCDMHIKVQGSELVFVVRNEELTGLI